MVTALDGVFHRPGKHCLHQTRSAVRRSVSRPKSELLHHTTNRLCVYRAGVLIVMHGRSPMTIAPRIPTMLGTEYVGFTDQTGTSRAPSAKN